MRPLRSAPGSIQQWRSEWLDGTAPVVCATRNPWCTPTLAMELVPRAEDVGRPRALRKPTSLSRSDSREIEASSATWSHSASHEGSSSRSTSNGSSVSHSPLATKKSTIFWTTRSLGSTWRPWRFENSASSAAEAAVPRGVGAMASSDEPIATRERKRHKTRNGEKRVSLSFAPRMFAKHRSPRDPMVQYWVEPSSPMLSLSGAGGPHPLILASMRCRLRWNVARAGVRGLGVSALACPPSMLSLISITI